MEDEEKFACIEEVEENKALPAQPVNLSAHDFNLRRLDRVLTYLSDYSRKSDIHDKWRAENVEGTLACLQVLYDNFVQTLLEDQPKRNKKLFDDLTLLRAKIPKLKPWLSGWRIDSDEARKTFAKLAKEMLPILHDSHREIIRVLHENKLMFELKKSERGRG